MRSQELSNYTEAELHDLIDRINIESVKQGLKKLVLPTLRMFQALINVEPNNKAEIEAIWIEFLRSEGLRTYLSNEVDKMIHKIEHEQLREALELIVPEIISTLSALVDVEPNDKEQLEAIWLKFMRSERLSTFIVGNIQIWLENIGLDELIVDAIVLFIKQAIEDNIKD